MQEPDETKCLLCERGNKTHIEYKSFYSELKQLQKNHYDNIFKQIADSVLQIDYNSIHLILAYIPNEIGYPDDVEFPRKYAENFPLLCHNHYNFPEFTCSHLKNLVSNLVNNTVNFIQIRRRRVSLTSRLLMVLAQMYDKNDCFYIAQFSWTVQQDAEIVVKMETYIDTNLDYLLNFCCQNSKSRATEFCRKNFVQNITKKSLCYPKSYLLHINHSQKKDKRNLEIPNNDESHKQYKFQPNFLGFFRYNLHQPQSSKT